MAHNSASQYYRSSKILILLVIITILGVLSVWAININISEGIKASYKNDSQSFVQRYNSYLESIETFSIEPTIRNFGDTQKCFGFLAVSIDKWDISISTAVEKHALEDISENYLYETWPNIRKINDNFIESVVIQNNILTCDQAEISETINDLALVFNSIKTTYKLN